MKTTLKNIAFFCFAAFFFAACSSSNPGIEIRDAVLFPNAKAQDIFKKSPQQMQKSIGGESLVDFVNEMQIGGVDNMMQTVSQFSRNDDNSALLDASLDVLTLEKTIFENEYLAIANIVDAGESEEKITGITQRLNTKYRTDFKQKLDKLNELGKQYAEKNGVQLHEMFLMTW